MSEKAPEQPTEGWEISLTSDRGAYVRARIYSAQTMDAFINALRTIKPLMPAPGANVRLVGIEPE
jgi:hypothetical protein